MSLKFKENITLAPLTTFNIGGLARYFVAVGNEAEVRKAVKFAHEKDIPIFVLAGGSNILVSDKGFPGLVIHNKISGFKIERRGDKTVVRVGSGENWDETVRRVVEENLSGIECLSGIPGSVGAAPVQNIGAYGQSFSDVAVEVKAIDLKTGKLEIFDKARSGLEYRKSIFNTTEAGRYFITEVIMELIKGGAPLLNYHDLKDRFSGKNPSLKEVRQAVIEIRAKKGMVILPGYECYKSVGSFFKNAIVEAPALEKILKLTQGRNWCKEPWFWKQADGKIKVSAACLIEQAGFQKGFCEGNIGISPKHTLALINCGGATAREMIQLAKKIQDQIFEKFGIKIEAEAQLIGFRDNPLTPHL